VPGSARTGCRGGCSGAGSAGAVCWGGGAEGGGSPPPRTLEPSAPGPVLLDLGIALAERAIPQAQVELSHTGMRHEVRGRRVEDDSSVLHHVAMVGDLERRSRILLDEQYREPQLVTKPSDQGHQMLHDE